MRHSEFLASPCHIHAVLKEVVVIFVASLMVYCHAINSNVVASSMVASSQLYDAADHSSCC